MISLIGDHCSNSDDAKVFTFGIGSGCSRHLVTGAAEAGRGQSFFVGDGETHLLKSKVVEALSMSSVPAYEDCSLNFNVQSGGYTQPTVMLGNLIRHKIVRHFSIMSENEFKELKV